MRKIQKILIGMFLGGVLLGGIGSGIAFAEYSSFRYAGKKLVGAENLVTREFDYAFDPSLGKIAISADYYDMGSRYGDKLLESDSTVPEGTIRYQITFNEQTIRPYLDYDEEEFDEDQLPEDSLAAPPENLTDEKDVVGITLPKQVPLGPGEEKRLQGHLTLRARHIDSGFGIWMACKDELLEELKQKKISDYQVSYIEDIRIRVNPATLPYVVDETW